MFQPSFRLTGPIAKALMVIEADRQLVATLPLTAPMLASLRRTARLLSTHFSTQIEGNRLSPQQVERVLEGEGNFPGRERDEAEVKCYFAALAHVERIAPTSSPLTEKEIRTIHGLVMTGKPKATPYRTMQNVIRDARTGHIVYLPPETSDVPTLMRELVAWVNQSLTSQDWPTPVVVALAHYQFATIHPYLDGNGRTARLLSNLLLHRHGYGLNGIYSLEEYYSANLAEYYAGLSVGPSHNYYLGRAEADVTNFVKYFCLGMADAFATVRMRAETAAKSGQIDHASLLRELDPQQRQALGLFIHAKSITRNDIAKFFKLSPRRAYLLCARWLTTGFLEIDNPATKSRTYKLGEKYASLL